MPERLRAARRARRADAVAAARGVRRGAAADRAAASVPARRSRSQPAPGRPGEAAGGGVRGHGQRPRARPLAGLRSRTRSWPCACTRRSTPRSPSAGATSATSSPRPRRWPLAFPSIRMRWRRRWRSPTACASTSRATSATGIPAPRTRRRCASWRSCARRGSTTATPPRRRTRERPPTPGSSRSFRSSSGSTSRGSSCSTTTCSSSRARSRSRSGGLTPLAPCCRPAAAAGRACHRSSAT